MDQNKIKNIVLTILELIVGAAVVYALFIVFNKPKTQTPTSDTSSPTTEQNKNQNTSGDQKKEKIVKLYYYNPELDKDENGNIACSSKGLVAVERKIPVTQTPIQDAIRLLIQGKLTNEEKAKGITTEFPLQGLELKGTSLNNGILTIQFNDPNHTTVGGSCRTAILVHQISTTAMQFGAVKEVRFLPEDSFQP